MFTKRSLVRVVDDLEGLVDELGKIEDDLREIERFPEANVLRNTRHELDSRARDLDNLLTGLYIEWARRSEDG